MKYIVIMVTLLFVTGCNGQDQTLTTKVGVKEIKEQVIGKEVQLLDVRTAEEYNNGHIDDAINIDISDKDKFVVEVNKLDKNKPIYVYCHMGGRSNKARKVLEQEGFKKIYDFSGGWKAWSKNN